VVSESERWEVKGNTVQYTGAVSMVSQYKPVSGRRLQKQGSTPPYGPLQLGKRLNFFFFL